MRLIYIIVISVMACSCATIRKQKSATTASEQRIDTASLVKEFSRETVTTEKSSAQITTLADSASTSGNISAEDTTEHIQQIFTNGLSIRTAIKPQVKHGKIIGYQIDSKAVVKPKTVDIPVDKTTTIKEKSNEQQSSKKTDNSSTISTTSDTTTFHLGFWGTAGLVAGLILVVLLLFYKFVRK